MGSLYLFIFLRRDTGFLLDQKSKKKGSLRVNDHFILKYAESLVSLALWVQMGSGSWTW